MIGYIIAALILVIIALILLPIRFEINISLRGAFARGRVRAGFFWGTLGVKLYFTVYKNAAGKPEARLQIGKHREKIINLSRIMDANKRIKKKAAKKKERKNIRRLIRTGLKIMRLRDVSVTGRLGSGDAAATALTIGAISSAAYSLFTPLANKPPRIDISPNFDETEFRLDLAGIVDVYIGKSTLELIRKWN